MVSAIDGTVKLRATIKGSGPKGIATALSVDCERGVPQVTLLSLLDLPPDVGAERSAIRYRLSGQDAQADTWNRHSDGIKLTPDDSRSFLRSLLSAETLFVELPGAGDAARAFAVTGLGELLAGRCL